MAIKKPLVLNSSGEIEQLQNTDSIANIDVLSLTNDESGAIVIGMPVYSDGNDGVKKAKADAVGTVNVVGLVTDTTVATTNPAAVQNDGVLVATTTQWDAIAGTTGGLTAGTIYYLSAATAGNITATAPTTAGQFVKRIGIALSTTELLIQIGSRIKL